VSLGSYPTLSLAAARSRALTMLAGEPEPASFKAIADEYLSRATIRTVNWQRDVLSRLVYPAFADRRIEEIRRSEIARLLDQIEDGSGPAMADATLAVVRRVMNWHASRSDDFRSPIVGGMARTKPHERARERVLTDDELRAIWRTAEGSVFGSYVRFLLLTAARRNEAAVMERAELAGGNWTLPAARNKTKVDLVRPLSAPALAIIAALPPSQGPLVFLRSGMAVGSFGRLKGEFDRACGATGWTLHDLRRTARSLMSRAGVPSDHAERCLGHVIGGVRGTYDRHEYHEEKRLAFEALASLIARIVDPQPNVVPMRSER
jgi:integrase